MNGLLKEKISTLVGSGRTVIAIDGSCASGKSTLADEIRELFGGTVIRADSFFLPPDMRAAERLSEPGGNFHRERFCDEVINGIRSSELFSYGVFDCKSGTVNRKVTVSENKLIIVEGSYCMHPRIGFDYNLRIFCTADYPTQLFRIAKRNGEGALSVFKERWIPLENKYFKTFDIQKSCDVTVVT